MNDSDQMDTKSLNICIGMTNRKISMMDQLWHFLHHLRQYFLLPHLLHIYIEHRIPCKMGCAVLVCIDCQSGSKTPQTTSN